MKRTAAFLLTIGLIGLAAIGVGTSDAAAQGGFDIAVKPAGGDYTNEFIGNISVGQKRVFILRARSASGADVLLSETFDPPGSYRVKYFRKSGANVTNQFRNSTLEVDLKPQKPKTFRITIKRLDSPPSGYCNELFGESPSLGSEALYIALNNGTC